MSDDLANYIKTNLAAGKTENQIKTELLQNGWTNERVNGAFNILLSMPSISQNNPQQTLSAIPKPADEVTLNKVDSNFFTSDLFFILFAIGVFIAEQLTLNKTNFNNFIQALMHCSTSCRYLPLNLWNDFFPMIFITSTLAALVMLLFGARKKIYLPAIALFGLLHLIYSVINTFFVPIYISGDEPNKLYFNLIIKNFFAVDNVFHSNYPLFITATLSVAFLIYKFVKIPIFAAKRELFIKFIVGLQIVLLMSFFIFLRLDKLHANKVNSTLFSFIKDLPVKSYK